MIKDFSLVPFGGVTFYVSGHQRRLVHAGFQGYTAIRLLLPDSSARFSCLDWRLCHFLGSMFQAYTSQPKHAVDADWVNDVVGLILLGYLRSVTNQPAISSLPLSVPSSALVRQMLFVCCAFIVVVAFREWMINFSRRRWEASLSRVRFAQNVRAYDGYEGGTGKHRL